MQMMEALSLQYNYEQVIEQIENTHRFGNKPGVEITAGMMEALGYPQKNIPYVHVAGTNGKGSTCAFLGAILNEAGFKTGVFTSPHLIDFEERIEVGGRRITKEDVTRLGNQLLNMEFQDTPTYFDYCLAMAVLYFSEQKCDIMVIETGLGGALDSTNALGIPLVSVITKIGYDHVSILGDTLSQIASEKAGIIKRGSSVVLESQESEAESVLLERIKHEDIKEYGFVSADDREYARSLGLKIPGVHQYENAAAAIKAATYVLESFGLKEAKIKQTIENGIKKATWPGCMEIVSKKPFIMVDGAHNGHGVSALKESLKTLYPDEKFSFYLAVMADKDYPKMIEQMIPLAADFTTVALENERAQQVEILADCIREQGVEVQQVNSVGELVDMLKSRNERKNIVFGSLYFVGEVKEYFNNDKML